MEKKMINQKEYLKKYLSSGKDKKKKAKKKKLNVGSKTVTIIDDDIDLNSMRPIEDGEFDIFTNTEDGPQIAGIVDERGPVDFSDKKRWKIITDDGYGDVSVTSIPRSERIAEDSGQRRVASPDPVKNHSESDCSPPRRRRKDSDSDEPKRGKLSFKKSRRRSSTPIQNASASQDSNFSPPRRTRRDSDSDLSPPRSRKSHNSKTKHSKERENSARSSRRDRGGGRPATAQSSPLPFNEINSSHSKRRNNSHKGDRRSGGRNSPEYKRGDQASGKIHAKSMTRRKNSGERKVHKISRKYENGSESDLSPPREARKNREDSDPDSSLTRKKNNNYQIMTAETSGFGQAPILRDRKTGKRRDLAAEAREQAEKDEKRQELEEKYAQWGKGLKQVEDRQQKLDRDIYEMSKPLARYADDADLERELKAQEREGDPMLAYMKRKQTKEGKQEPEKPKYSGPFMPNRFGIRPGYRWDGVDRSNGYEKKWFDAQNARKAVQEEAYKWSTADM